MVWSGVIYYNNVFCEGIKGLHSVVVGSLIPLLVNVSAPDARVVHMCCWRPFGPVCGIGTVGEGGCTGKKIKKKKNNELRLRSFIRYTQTYFYSLKIIPISTVRRRRRQPRDELRMTAG